MTNGYICTWPIRGSQLWGCLPELLGKTIVCDCPWQSFCEVDITGLCFDATASSAPRVSRRVLGHPDASSGRQSVVLATTVSRASALSISPHIPWCSQESIILAFLKLFPQAWFSSSHGWRFDESSSVPSLSRMAASLWGELGRPPGPLLSSKVYSTRSTHVRGTTSGSTFWEVSHWYCLDLIQTNIFTRLGFWGGNPYLQRIPLDSDLHFAAFMTATCRGTLREVRQTAIKVMRELQRRWRGVTSHLRHFQSPAIQQVIPCSRCGLLWSSHHFDLLAGYYLSSWPR